MALWQAPLGTAPPRTGVDRTGVVVFGSDQGMCGQFNEQVLGDLDEWLETRRAASTETYFLAVGVRAAGGMRDRGLAVDGESGLPGTAAGITPVVQDLLLQVEAWRARRRLGRILLFYNRRLTASTSEPSRTQLLPIPERLSRPKQKKWAGHTLPLLTMDRTRLVSALVRQYLFVALFRAYAESRASENAARIASMQSAERNITELLDDLRREYNQRRQTSITEELLEVVTGFEVLEGEGQRSRRELAESEK
jgi:F-type H+-transporting ATPase subunit gamma